MRSLTFKLDATSDGVGGFNEVVFDKSVTGFDPSTTHSSFQASCTGLDGGTFSVYVKPKGAPQYVEHVLDATEADGVLLQMGFIFDAIAVVFANLGGGASPRVIGTFISRSF